jgi:hypothetical protein
MPKVRSLTLKFVPSASLDVVGYALYSELVPAAVSYDSIRHDIGMPPIFDNQMVFDMASLNLPEGEYNFGLVAVDDVGNESSFDLIDNVPLDLTAPDAPSGAKVIRI